MRTGPPLPTAAVSSLRLLIPLVVIAASACSTGGVAGQTATAPSQDAITVRMMTSQGGEIGTAFITDSPPPGLASQARTATGPRQGQPMTNGVTIGISVAGLPAGTHGFHVHAVGRCDAPDFMTAGPHLNPDHRSHGVMDPGGPHAGDLPNLTIDRDGTAVAVFVLGHLAMSEITSSPSGASLLIDANPDDNVTNPDGNSGAHIACGVIRPGTAPAETPSPSASTSPTPHGMITADFSGLTPGSFPVHLHSTCNPSQSFHLAVIGTLMVGQNGDGEILVPSQDFGHGWCLIVYSSTSLQSALTMQEI